MKKRTLVILVCMALTFGCNRSEQSGGEPVESENTGASEGVIAELVEVATGARQIEAGNKAQEQIEQINEQRVKAMDDIIKSLEEE